MKPLVVLFALLALVGCGMPAPTPEDIYLSAMHKAGYTVEDKYMLEQGKAVCSALDKTNDVAGLIEFTDNAAGPGNKTYVSHLFVYSVKYICPENESKLLGFIVDNGGNV